MKNFFLQTLLRALAPFAPAHPSQNQRRFLIVTTTALGDTLWATPAIESLRKSFPTSFIGAAVSPIGQDIFLNNPHIDRCYVVTNPLLPHFFKLQKALYRERFDTVLVFHASQRLMLPLCSLVGASQIVGTAGINKGLDTYLTNPLPLCKEHEIARRLHIVEHIGAKTHAQTLSFFLAPEEKIVLNRSRKQIALHPGSKDPFKRWPLKNFASLGRALQAKLDCDLWITGSSEEEFLIQSLLQEIPGAQRINAPQGLRPFTAFLSEMDLIISNDTGSFHLACALDVPAIGLYAPTDPLLCGPYKARRAVTIKKPPSCTPCIKRKCQSPFCLLQIGSCEILEAALKWLM